MPRAHVSKGVAIDAEAVVAGQGDEVAGLPRTVALLHAALDGLRLLFQTLGLQRTHPRVYHERRQVWNEPIAGRIVVGGEQLLVILAHLLGNVELHLRRSVATVGNSVAVDGATDVEHHIVVGTVAVVPVAEPVGGAVVNLHVAHPQGTVDFHFRIEEVGATVAVVQSGVNHFHPCAADGGQRRKRKEFMLPAIMQQLLHGLMIRE